MTRGISTHIDIPSSIEFAIKELGVYSESVLGLHDFLSILMSSV